MGNRAVIATKKEDIGIYLHWNGGRDSVEAFLTYCKMRNFRTPEQDCYGWARLCQVIGNFFGGGTSIGINKVECLDCNNGDNGMYIIENWEIVGRKYFDGCEQSEYDLMEMVVGIDECQPESDQLGKEFIMAKEYTPEELSIGDEVFVKSFEGGYEKFPIIGNVYDEYIKKSFWLISKYGGSDNPAENPNNLVCKNTDKIKAIKH